MTLNDALNLTKDKRVFGLAEKGMSGRLALRFKTSDALSNFAKEYKFEDTSHLARWKVTGYPLTGGHVNVLYMDSKEAVFHSSNRGSDLPMYYMDAGQGQQVKFIRHSMRWRGACSAKKEKRVHQRVVCFQCHVSHVKCVSELFYSDLMPLQIPRLGKSGSMMGHTQERLLRPRSARRVSERSDECEEVSPYFSIAVARLCALRGRDTFHMVVWSPMAFRARTVEQSRSVSYVCNFRGVVDLRDLPYAPVEQWCVGSSISHVDRSHKMQWGVSFSLSSFSFMFSYIDRLAATRNQLLHALRGNSLFKVLEHNVNGISSVGKFPAICSLDADVLALTETQATTNNQRLLIPGNKTKIGILYGAMLSLPLRVRGWRLWL